MTTLRDRLNLSMDRCPQCYGVIYVVGNLTAEERKQLSDRPRVLELEDARRPFHRCLACGWSLKAESK